MKIIVRQLTKLRKLCFYRRASVHTGGGVVCLSACWDTTPPQEQIPPGVDTPERRPLLRTVRILLECILVCEKVRLIRAQRKLQKDPPDSYPSYYSPVHYHILGDFSMRIAVNNHQVLPQPVADLIERPLHPKFSQFHAVFQKIWQNHMLALPGGLAPPPMGNPGSAPVNHYYYLQWRIQDFLRGRQSFSLRQKSIII